MCAVNGAHQLATREAIGQYQLLVDEFGNDYTHISVSETRQNIHCQTPAEVAKVGSGISPNLHP